MLPVEIIAVMKNKGWLRTEPFDTKERITSAVRYLLIKHGMSVVQLGDQCGVARGYMRRKIIQHRWTVPDLDILTEIFDSHPSDLVAGYRQMADIDAAEEEKDNYDDE